MRFMRPKAAKPKGHEDIQGYYPPYNEYDFKYPILQDEDTFIISILDPIESPKDMFKVFEVLTVAKVGQTVILKVTTPGGYLDTTTMLLEHIKYCRAKVIIEPYGTVASAGTLLVIGGMKNGAEVIIPDYLEFMIHSYSHGTYGKSHEVAAYIKYMEVAGPTMFKEIYSGFLTQSEIDSVLDGKDFYFTATECKDRMTKLFDSLAEEDEIQALIDESEHNKAVTQWAIKNLEDNGYKVSKPTKPKTTKESQ